MCATPLWLELKCVRKRATHPACARRPRDGLNDLRQWLASGTVRSGRIHRLDQHGADLVSLLQDSPQYCGLAYRMATESTSFASSAFSIVHHSCATGYYSFAHEIGHTMGLVATEAANSNIEQENGGHSRTNESSVAEATVPTDSTLTAKLWLEFDVGRE